MTNNPERTWKLGYTLFMVIPFLGLATLVFDLPRWAEVVVVVAILVCVFFGSKILIWGKDGWRPSRTLPEPRPHDEP